MAPATAHRLANEARGRNGLEMSWRQQAIVDTCFEEGQYESAILNLEQLRSPSYIMSVSHVRQLIYIALHPISEAVSEKTTKSIYDSPSKIHQAVKTVISPSAVKEAQQLLFSLATTQFPESLARALPSYESTVDAATNAIEDLGDSDISRESLCVKGAKDCWSLLAEGFLSRVKILFSTAKRKGRRRPADIDEMSPADDQMEASCNVVADSAWFMFDWLLTVFDRDEGLWTSKGNPRYSPLLLAQIPPTRNGASKWDVATPLAVAMFSLQQVDPFHQRMGAQLMILLINLSLTPHLNFSMFVASAFGCLSSAAPEHLYFLLSALPPSLQVHQFKVALCYGFIKELGMSGRACTDNHHKPLARARKTRLPREGDQMQTLRSPVSASGKVNHIPPCQVILDALETKIPEMMDLRLFLQVKFELLLSYGMIQSKIPAADKDEEWTNALRDKALFGTLGVAFDPDYGEDAVRLGKLAQSIVSAWA
ncbi:hypothetical protein APHAL10511_003731 [Amanita phalloides]|nr:hypothetical protein APHAL10511_003731 [Amanita phalloides]